MALGAVDIVNSALLKIGVDRIDALTDNNTRAIFANEQYAKRRDALLISHPWNFAMARLELAEVTPAPINGFAHKYALTSTVLRVLEVNDDSSVLWSVEESGYLHTDEDECTIRYIKQITDTTRFSKLFEEALALDLAADLCMALTQNASHAANLYTAAQRALAQARSFDAQEGYGAGVEADLWFNSRY